MHPNLGITDQNARLLVSVLMIAVAAAFGSGATWLGIVGALLLLTANFGVCPIYSLIGIDTRKEGEEP